jgi:hypothetical protein
MNALHTTSALALALPLLLYTPSAHAGWGTSGCAPSWGNHAALVSSPYANVTPVPSAPLRWVPVEGYPDQVGLMQGSTQAGIWILSESRYYSLQGKSWIPAPCPIEAPPQANSLNKPQESLPPGSKLIGEEINCGLDKDKIGKDGGAGYRLNGHPCTKKEAYAAVAGDSLTDDSSLLRLTIVGDEGTRKRVLADIDATPYLKDWKGKLVIRSYAPDHWAVKGLGFLAEGETFSLLVTLPTGEVLHRQADYSDGAEGLSEALRRIDPNRDPKKDPDRRKSEEPSLDSLVEQLKKVPQLVWVVLGGLLLLWYLNKKKQG